MFKKLIGKIKNISAAIVANSIPGLKGMIEAAKEADKIQVYTKGGFIPGTPGKFELDDDEFIIVPEEGWKKDNQALQVKIYDNEAWRELAKAAQAATISMDKMAKSINEFAQKQISAEERQNTNNWRKMHGLPMRRKAGRRKSVNKKA